MLAAARVRRGGTVVVDLPRRMDNAVAEVLAQLDIEELFAVIAELRAVAAAGRMACRWHGPARPAGGGSRPVRTRTRRP
ncbi:hypothetical protein SALBM311S_10678 [Streptomyces alboniger]